MPRKRRLVCSFCGRNEAEVEKLVAGPRVRICDRCVATAARMMAADSVGPQAPEVRRSALQRVMDWLRRHDRQGSDRRSECRMAEGWS